VQGFSYFSGILELFIMMKALSIMLCSTLLFSCATMKLQYGKNLSKLDYNYVKVDHPFRAMVLSAYKNQTICGRVISYTLLIVQPIEMNLPSKVSVVLPCDNTIYSFRDTLEICPIPNENSHNDVLYLTAVKRGKKDSIVSRIIGSEFPAVWAKVNKR
jgi:hypothetical protein